MSKKKENQEQKTDVVLDKISEDVLTQYEDAETAHRSVRDGHFPWSERESLFYNRYKNSKEDTKSVYSSGELTGLVIDASHRVMGQMPTGRFRNIGDTNIANAVAMNLMYEHYVIPHAITGGQYLQKQRQVNMYSRVYGCMPVFVPFIVSDEYTGPDMELIHPRRFRPQPGKYAIEDMDYCFIETTVTKEWVENEKKNEDSAWTNLEQVSVGEQDTGSQTEKEQSDNSKKNVIVLLHKLTKKGAWTVWDKASQMIVFHDKDFFPRMPIAVKRTIPMLDSFWDLGDFQRGETPQKTLDTLMRAHLDTVEMSVRPPLILDPEEVVLDSIVYAKGAKWFVKDGKVNGIQPARINPDGLATFTTTYNMVKANLLALSATTDTAVTKSQDLGFGKTPQALKMQEQREGARDAADRANQEQFIEYVANLMIDTIIHKRKQGLFKSVEIENMSEALEKIASRYPDADMSLFGKDSKKIDLDKLEGNIRYEIDSGSIVTRDNTSKELITILNMATQNPHIMESMTKAGKTVNWSEALKRYAIDKGVMDWDKIIIDAESPESVDGIGDDESTADIPEESDVSPEELAMAAQAQMEQEQQIIPQQ